jgi:hypothetical protein
LPSIPLPNRFRSGGIVNDSDHPAAFVRLTLTQAADEAARRFSVREE